MHVACKADGQVLKMTCDDIIYPCRLFLLDMLLGNPDRLPCEALGWRGNPHNILYCQGGCHAYRMVAIDSAVQRRPPGMPATHVCCPWTKP